MTRAKVPAVGNNEMTDKQAHEILMNDIAIVDFSKVEAKHFVFQDNIKLDSDDCPDPELVDQAQKIQKEILEIVKETGLMLMELGKRLIPFKDEKKYRYLGYSNFQEWYQSVQLSKTTVYRAMNIYETFILTFNIPEEEVYSKDIRKLDLLLPLKKLINPETNKMILSESNVSEWIGKCDLSESDLIEEVQEAKGYVPPSKEIEEAGEFLIKGTFVLVPTTVDVSGLEKVIDRKVPMELYKNTDGDLVVRVF